MLNYNLHVGMFVKEVNPSHSRPRFGVINKMTKCYAWVESCDGVHWKKHKKNLVKSTRKEWLLVEKQTPTPTDIDNGPITVGTMIVCIFGMNVGAIGRVVGETKCFCKFENHGKAKRVTKQYARRVVKVEAGNKRRRTN